MTGPHGDYEEDPCPLCELNRDITAQSILSTCFVGDHPYTKAGEAIEKLAERGYSIVPTPCRHSIYNHGCPSCDERDPEGNEVCAVCGEIYCPGCELAAAEKVMDPILRRWFAYDCAPHEVEHYAENAAVDLSWALQDAGLLARNHPHTELEEER